MIDYEVPDCRIGLQSLGADQNYVDGRCNILLLSGCADGRPNALDLNFSLQKWIVNCFGNRFGFEQFGNPSTATGIVKGAGNMRRCVCVSAAPFPKSICDPGMNVREVWHPIANILLKILIGK